MAASWRAGRSTCSRAMIAEPPSANPIVARTIGPPSSGVMWIPEPVLARTLPLLGFPASTRETPLLANIALAVMDEHFARAWQGKGGPVSVDSPSGVAALHGGLL